jgi:hypothetical protein
LALKLISLLLLVTAIFAVTGCDQQVGPNDKTVTGKEYKDIVNQGVPENEKNQTNTMRDAALTEPANKR